MWDSIITWLSTQLDKILAALGVYVITKETENISADNEKLDIRDEVATIKDANAKLTRYELISSLLVPEQPK